MSVREKDDPALYTKIQEQNLLRQYDLLTNCIEIGLAKGIEAFDKYTLWALNTGRQENSTGENPREPSALHRRPEGRGPCLRRGTVRHYGTGKVSGGVVETPADRGPLSGSPTETKSGSNGGRTAHPSQLVILFGLLPRRMPHPFASCAEEWAARSLTDPTTYRSTAPTLAKNARMGHPHVR